MFEILQEVAQTTKKISGIDPSKPGNLKAVITDDTAWNSYAEGLSESIEDPKDKNEILT